MKTYNDLTREQRIEKVLSQRRKDICVVLENLTDEKNISMILRTTEALGIGKIYIIYDSKKPKLSQGISSGAKNWLKIKFYKSINTCLKILKKEGCKIYGTLVNPEAQSLFETKFDGKVALIMGSESQGLSPKAQENCDYLVYIPMFGLTESLNVSVSTGIFLYEVIRQKTGKIG